MKSREEIEKELEDARLKMHEKRAKEELIIELLLDIRDIALQIHKFK